MTWSHADFTEGVLEALLTSEKLDLRVHWHISAAIMWIIVMQKDYHMIFINYLSIRKY